MIDQRGYRPVLLIIDRHMNGNYIGQDVNGYNHTVDNEIWIGEGEYLVVEKHQDNDNYKVLTRVRGF